MGNGGSVGVGVGVRVGDGGRVGVGTGSVGSGGVRTGEKVGVGGDAVAGTCVADELGGLGLCVTGAVCFGVGVGEPAVGCGVALNGVVELPGFGVCVGAPASGALVGFGVGKDGSRLTSAPGAGPSSEAISRSFSASSFIDVSRGGSTKTCSSGP